MFFFVGLAVVFGAVFGGYVIAGGKMAPIIKAAPFEFLIIGGSAIGASLVANSFPVFKAAMGGIGKCIKGPSFHQADYLALMLLVGKLQTVMKKEGVVALESHVENPDSSPIFGEYPRLLKDHALIHLITDSIRLLVVSSSAPRPDAVEDVMNLAIMTHHHEALKPAVCFANLAGALPALGIVACVLGVVKTMGAIDQPPSVLGALIGGALVGTFLGVLFAYGIAEPLGNRLTQIIDEEGQMYNVVKQIIVGTLNGHPVPVIIEAARVGLTHDYQPSFSEVFDGLRGK